MDARERWQALQAHLASAQALADTGDRSRALDQVELALAIDPDFLAAHSLKERLDRQAPSVTEPSRGDDRPPASSGLDAIEAKVSARRAQRRLAVATEAIRRRDFAAAAAALDEARTLSADPERVLRVERAFAQARRQPAERATTGRRALIAATVVVGVLGASYLVERGGGRSPAATQSPTPPALPTTVGAIVSPSTKPEVIRLEPSRRSAPAPPAASPADPISPAIPAPEALPERRQPLPPPIAQAPVEAIGPTLRPIDPPPASPPAIASTTGITAPPAGLTQPVAPPDEAVGVREILQRYRAAYDSLNARSAHAVWPAVDEHALARAFDGLASQQLRFDACDVNVRGDEATANCRGTATYVPKIGSGDPMVEPRTWAFTLRKAAGQWAIATARVER